MAQCGFCYAVDPCVVPEDDFFSMDGMNERGTYYVVARLSDGMVTRVVYEDFRNVWLPTVKFDFEEDANYREVGGTLPELLAQGESPRRLFFSMQCWLHCLPDENRHELAAA